MNWLQHYRKILLLSSLVLALPEGSAGNCASWDSLTTALTQGSELALNDLSAIRQSQVVHKVLDASDSQEVVMFGGIQVAASLDTYVDNLLDIVEFKQSDEILAIGKFSNPPQLTDLDKLSLTDREIRSIRDCNIGDCAIKMSADMIRRFGQDVDWSTPDSDEQALKVYRKLLLETVRGYIDRGGEALVHYVDKDANDPTEVGREISEMLQKTDLLSKCAPEFLTYLDRFPQENLEPTEDFIYWDKSQFNGKPVITMTHVSIYRPEGKKGRIVFAASKQIYATHYFEASLGLTTVLAHKGTSSQPRSYLFYLNRSRFDFLGGLFNFVKKPLFSSRMKGGIKNNLFEIQQKLETAQKGD